MARITVGLPNPVARLELATDALEVSLAETAVSPVSWHLKVSCRTNSGERILGAIDTVPSAVLTQFQSAVIPAPIVVGRERLAAFLSRSVLSAYCPGAIAWDVEATSNPLPTSVTSTQRIAAMAELQLSGSQRPSGLQKIGVVPITRRGFVDPPGANTLAGGGAPIQNSQIISTMPVYFRAIFGANEAAATRWVMIFNQVAVPGGVQAQPIYSIHVPAGSAFSFILPDGAQEIDGARFFDTGLVWVSSSTAGLFTAANDVSPAGIDAHLLLGV